MQDNSEGRGILLARMNGRDGGYQFVTEGNGLISIPEEVSNPVRYFPEEREEEVWYYMDDIPPAKIPAPPGRTEARLLPHIDPEDMRTGNYQFLAYLDGDGNILYQVTPAKSILRGKALIEIGTDKEVRVVQHADRIAIGTTPDLIQCQWGSRTVLLFQKIRKMFKIAPEMIGVYQKLEKEAIQKFLDSGLVYLCGFEKEMIGRSNLRRLHETNMILESFSDKEKQEIRDYIARMFPKLYYHKERKAFAIESNSNLRDVLYCLKDQAFLRYRDGKVCIAQHYFIRERRK